MKFGLFIMKAGSQTGGLATYEEQLVRELAAIDTENEYHVLGYSPQTLDSLGVRQENFHMHAVRPHNKWIGMTLTVPNAMRRLKLPMVHGAFAVPWRVPCPYAFTVHDYYMFAHPELLPTLLRIRLQGMYRRAFAKAEKLIFISEFVRDMVARNFDVPAERMAVVYNGCSAAMQPGDPDEARDRLRRLHGIDAPFFLFTGRLEPRKNIMRMLEAFARFHREVDPEMKFVLVGEKTWCREQVDRFVSEHHLEESIIEVGHLDHTDLPHFYRACRALLFITLAEGFGLPIIEAMACGAPVITSTTTCMPEISGGAALLADPLEVDDIVLKMELIHRDDELRGSLIAKGLVRASGFSWRKTAEQTLAVYQSMLS